jgi:hypothetical protein
MRSLYAAVAVVALFAAAPLARAQQPITIGDGSVCIDGGDDEVTAAPGRPRVHERAMTFFGLVVERPGQKDKCAPAPPTCESDFCVVYQRPPRTVTVRFREGGATRDIRLTIDKDKVTMEMPDDLDTNFEPDQARGRRRRVRRKATGIESILIEYTNGPQTTISCKGGCRMTIWPPTSRQAAE